MDRVEIINMCAKIATDHHDRAMIMAGYTKDAAGLWHAPGPSKDILEAADRNTCVVEARAARRIEQDILDLLKVSA